MPHIVNGRPNFESLRAVADRYYRKCLAEANALCLAGGIGGYVGNHLHNALLDYGKNRGWGAQVTDWSALRRADWLMRVECYRAHDLVDRISQRWVRRLRNPVQSEFKE